MSFENTTLFFSAQRMLLDLLWKQFIDGHITSQEHTDAIDALLAEADAHMRRG